MIEKLTLILGGARSGKSSYAEQLAQKSGLAPVYLATAEPHNSEMHERIKAHQQRRPAHWSTLEEPIAIVEALKKASTENSIVLLDCLTLWLSNLFASEHDANGHIVGLLSVLQTLPGPVIIVSNEVGLGIVPENALARAFRDVHGALNQKIASQADLVIFMAAGLPLVIKNNNG